MTRLRPAAWLIAAVALFLLAVAGYALLVHASSQHYWKQIDTAVYQDGGIAVRNQPAMLYALELGPAKLPFTYTPFAALLFAAASGASFATWQVGLAVLTIGLLPVVANLSLGLAGRPAGLARAAAAFAIAAVGLWLEPVPPGPAGLDIHAALRQLSSEGIRSVLVEGGASVIASVLTAGMVHRVIASISPRILGHGPPILGDLSQELAAGAVPLDGHSVYLMDGTIIVAADIAGAAEPSDGQTPLAPAGG